MGKDLIGKQPDRHIYLVKEFLVLIRCQCTADCGIISDIVQELLLSFLTCMSERDHTTRHSTDDTAVILGRSRRT